MVVMGVDEMMVIAVTQGSLFFYFLITIIYLHEKYIFCSTHRSYTLHIVVWIILLHISNI